MARQGGSADGEIIIGTNVDMGGMNTGLNRIQKASNKLAATLAKAFSVGSFINFGKSALNAASDLQEVQNIVDVAFGDMADQVDDFAKGAIEQFGLSELTAKQTAGSFMSMGKSLGVTAENARNMSLQLTALSGDFASFYNISQDYARTALSAVYTGETETLKRYGISLTEASLQEYMNKKGIDAKIDSLDGASKAMLRYNYILEQTNFVSGDFARTSGSWANQVRLLQQSWTQFLITVGNGLKTVLTPVLTVLRNIVAALNTIAKMIGGTIVKVFGISTEATDTASSSYDSLADSAESAGDAAKSAGKDAKKSLAAWDDLNVLQKNSDSSGNGSGSGSGSSASPFADVEEYKVENKALEEYIKSFDSLYELGKNISNILKNTLKDIDWPSVYSAAETFGTGLAQFLNGLISPSTFEVVGSSIAGALNTVIYGALAFGQTFDWSNFGTSIGSAINGFIFNVDASALGKTINTYFNGVLKAMRKAVTKVDWSTVGKKIGEMLLEIDVGSLCLNFAKLLISGLTAAVETYANAFSMAPIQTAIVTALAAPAIITAFATFKTNLETLKTAWKTFSNSLLVNAIGVQLLETVPGRKFAEQATVITTALASIKQAFQDNILKIGGVVAAAASLVVVKTQVENITTAVLTGEGNITAALAAIAAAAAVASAAVYAAFGPAGLAVLGVAAIVAAFVGFQSAVNEFHCDNVSAAVYEAVANPGGVPVDELFQTSRDEIDKLGESFGNLSDKSTELDTVDDNISDIGDEIQLLSSKWELGLIDQETYINQLISLYDQLETAVTTKFETMRDIVIAGLGADGYVSTALQQNGVDIDTYTKKVVSSFDEQEQQIYELITEMKELAATDPSNPRIDDLRMQIGNLASGASETDYALDKLRTTASAGNLDLTDFYNAEHNAIDADKVLSALKNLQDGITTARETAETETSTLLTAIKQTGDPELINTIETAIPVAMQNMNNDISTIATNTTNIVQTQVLDGLKQRIEEAANEYDNSGVFKKFLQPKDDFILAQVQEYKTNVIDPLSSTIETGLNEVGVSGAGWATTAADSIISSLFTTEYTDVYGTEQTARLKGDWESILDNATLELPGYATAKGTEIVQGFADGVTENSEVATAAVQSWSDETKQAISTAATESNESIKSAYEGTSDWVNTNVTEPIKQSATETATETVEAAKSAETDVEEAWDGTASWFDTNVTSQINSSWNTFEQNIKTASSTALSDVETTWAVLPTWFDTNVISPVKSKWDTFKTDLTTLHKTLWEDIKGIWKVAPDWVDTTLITPIFTSYTTFVDDTKTSSENLWKDIQTTWEVANTWFSETVLTPVKEAFTQTTDAIKEAFDGVWSSVKSGVVSAMNAAISAVESMINNIVDKVNQFIEDVNEAVSEANELEGVHISTMSTFSHVSIARVPAMAKGGVIPPNAPFMAMLGDQKSGTNIEAPLDTIVQAMTQALSSMNIGGSAQNVTLNIDGKTLARLTVPYNLDELNRRGYNVNVLKA